MNDYRIRLLLPRQFFKIWHQVYTNQELLVSRRDEIQRFPYEPFCTKVGNE